MLTKKFSIFLVTALLALFSVESFAQKTLAVSGTVKDNLGEPVIGAGVFVKGTSIGSITDADGYYKLTNVPAGAVLTISAIGYKEAEAAVDSRAIVDITLEQDLLMLNDAVVIGYGTQRKGDITSAVASVKSEDFLAGNIGDAAQLIKGKVAGLNVTKGNGDPGASSTDRKSVV